MGNSILNSTKKILGIPFDYEVFDLDIITHINSAFSVLCQLGVGPVEGFFIEDDLALWENFPVPNNQMSLVKTYVYLKVRSLFDPPTTSFLIEATNNQIREFEWRLNVYRETLLAPHPPDYIPIEEVAS
ncbi:MAG: hypothetical protein ABWY25_07300 [Paenisporosarcina sp.]